MSTKLSKNRIAKVLIELAESGVSSKKIAKILAIIFDDASAQESELVIHDIRNELETRLGIVVAEVTTATPLTPALEKQATEVVKKQTNAESIELVSKVDPNIIGGIIVTTANFQLDDSVRTKLKKLKQV